MKVLIDSSGWIHYFTGGQLAKKYGTYLKHPTEIVTPAIVVYEVYKIVKREKGEETAVLIAGQLHATQIVPLSTSLALTAADMSLTHRLAMADAIVYATALETSAKLITSDSDLKRLPGVVYLQ